MNKAYRDHAAGEKRKTEAEKIVDSSQCPMEKDNEEGMVFDIKKDPYNHMMKMVFCRWKPFILRAMDFDEGNLTHFSRFTKQLPITQKVLSENLRQLEEDGLISRTVLATVPPQVEYRLTERGRKLVPLLDEVYKWGWEDMRKKGLPIDALGEMWHGFREKDEELMEHPYKKTHTK